MKNFFTRYLPLFLLLLDCSAVWAQQYCWTISDNTDRVYRFNYATGVSSTNFAVPSSAEASTLSKTGDTLYILNNDDLYRMVLTAATPSAVWIAGKDIDDGGINGSQGVQDFSDYDAMDIDKFGNLWAAARLTGSIHYVVVINPATGLVRKNYFGTNKDYLVVRTKANKVVDCLAIDPLTQKMYANISDGTGTAGTEDLYEINKTTGDTMIIAKFPYADFEGMCFSADGDLLVTSGANGPTATNQKLFRINFTNASATELYTLPGGDNETCECVKSQNGVNEISGYVFWDNNYSQTKDAGDTTKRNHRVYLYRDVNANGTYQSGTDVLLKTAITNDAGYYYFREAFSGSTDRFLVISEIADLPAGASYTTNNLRAITFTTSGNFNSNNNFGYNSPRNIIKGKVFGDANEDGVDNSGAEIGVSNIKVGLYRDNNGDGIINGSDQFINGAITGTNGKYEFSVPYNIVGVNKRVATSSDDAEEDPGNGSDDLGSDDLDFKDRHIGVRFQTLGIPQGAKILEARVYFTSKSNKTGASGVFYGHNVDNSPTFAASNYTITGRAKTTGITWNPGSWSTDQEYSSPDLKTIAQAIVNRSGWTTASSMSFMWIMSAAGSNEAHSFDKDPNKAPRLYISYTIDANYVIKADSTGKPTGSHMTTDVFETASFSSAGNTDSLNNFGMWGGSALPVEWLSFDAQKFGSDVLLKWKTASELNNDRFEIERSDDAINFEYIGEKDGKGNAANISTYDFIDETPRNGLNFYRLKQIDFDGEFEYSEIRLVEFNQKPATRLVIYPNPSNDYVYLHLNHLNGSTEAHMEIVNLQGQVQFGEDLIISNAKEWQKKIQIDHLPTGSYFVRIDTNIGSYYSRFSRN
jgi:hypothetical protein